MIFALPRTMPKTRTVYSAASHQCATRARFDNFFTAHSAITMVKVGHVRHTATRVSGPRPKMDPCGLRAILWFSLLYG
jgi:hypothetical protein